jgi:hypothetical protein
MLIGEFLTRYAGFDNRLRERLPTPAGVWIPGHQVPGYQNPLRVLFEDAEFGILFRDLPKFPGCPENIHLDPDMYAYDMYWEAPQTNSEESERRLANSAARLALVIESWAPVTKKDPALWAAENDGDMTVLAATKNNQVEFIRRRHPDHFHYAGKVHVQHHYHFGMVSDLPFNRKGRVYTGKYADIMERYYTSILTIAKSTVENQ